MQWPSFKPFQKQALAHLKRRCHLVCISATGSGKSLIYEFYATEKAKKTVLITPLIALARQQAGKLEQLGNQVYLGPGQVERKKPFDLRESGIWIASPEQLSQSHYKSLLARWRPDFWVVDECHCLWDWGDRFRPSFRKLPELCKQDFVERSLWLTATLPSRARRDLKEQLPEPIVEMGRFSLPENLFLEVQKVSWTERMGFLVQWIQNREGAGIVFAPTRDSTMRITRVFASLGKRVAVYHAGLGAEERRAVERQVAEQSLDILVCTSAFGMGMDYPHLKWVVLWQPPASLLQLSQALGRVGRDASTAAYGLILWSHEDFKLLQWVIQNSSRLKEETEMTLQFLETWCCRVEALTQYYDSRRHNRTSQHPDGCGKCDFCLKR